MKREATPPVLSLSVLPDARRAPPGAHELHVVLEVRAGEGAPIEGGRPAIAAVLALDVSGSMAGPPLAQVVASIDRIVDLLGPGDRLGVAAFSNRGSEVVPLAPLDPAHRRLVRARAARVVAAGGTNVEDGLRTALAMHGHAEGAARRAIILLSDGQPNGGMTTPDELRDLAASMRPRASISSLGYGASHDERVLDAVARGGGGVYRYVMDPAVARLEIAQALGAQADVVAERPRLRLVPEPGVRIEGFLGGARPSFDAAGVVVELGDLSARGVAAVVVKVRATLDDPSRAGRLLAAELEWTEPGSARIHRASGVASLDVGAGPIVPDPVAAASVLVARVDDARSRSRDLADRGNWDGAAAELRAVLAAVDTLLAAVAPADLGDAGAVLEEVRELLVDEAVAMERRPDPEAYGELRRQTQVASVRDAGGGLGGHGRAMQIGAAGPVPEAYLVVVAGADAGTRHRLGPSCTVGRTASADVVVPSAMVSRRHARVFVQDGAFWVADLGSTNPTLVNGRGLGRSPHKLVPGDTIGVGDTVLGFERPGS